MQIAFYSQAWTHCGPCPDIKGSLNLGRKGICWRCCRLSGSCKPGSLHPVLYSSGCAVSQVSVPGTLLADVSSSSSAFWYPAAACRRHCHWTSAPFLFSVRCTRLHLLSQKHLLSQLLVVAISELCASIFKQMLIWISGQMFGCWDHQLSALPS